MASVHPVARFARQQLRAEWHGGRVPSIDQRAAILHAQHHAATSAKGEAADRRIKLPLF